MYRWKSKRRAGFTLVELLVVISIITIMVALLVVGAQTVRGTANRLSGENNLYQLGTALHHYHLLHKAFPTESGSSYTGGTYAITGGQSLTGGTYTSQSANNTTTDGSYIGSDGKIYSGGTYTGGTVTGSSGTSFYTSLLPFMEEKNALATTPIKSYLLPGRRGIEVGAKRDFGYAATNPLERSGSSILDSAQNVSVTDITSGAGNTYLLTSLWMNAKDYTAGTDPTDVGWSKAPNSRMYGSAVKRDGDTTGNTSYLGSPFANTLPILYADGHVAGVSYQGYTDHWAATTTGSTLPDSELVGGKYIGGTHTGGTYASNGTYTGGTATGGTYISPSGQSYSGGTYTGGTTTGGTQSGGASKGGEYFDANGNVYSGGTYTGGNYDPNSKIVTGGTYTTSDGQTLSGGQYFAAAGTGAATYDGANQAASTYAAVTVTGGTYTGGTATGGTWSPNEPGSSSSNPITPSSGSAQDGYNFNSTTPNANSTSDYFDQMAQDAVYMNQLAQSGSVADLNKAAELASKYSQYASHNWNVFDQIYSNIEKMNSGKDYDKGYLQWVLGDDIGTGLSNIARDEAAAGTLFYD